MEDLHVSSPVSACHFYKLSPLFESFYVEHLWESLPWVGFFCFTLSPGVHWTPQSDRGEIADTILRKHNNASTVFEEMMVFG